MKALQEASHVEIAPSDALSVQELTDLFGLCRMATASRIRKLVAAGKAIKTTKQIRRANGMVYPVTAYRLVKDDER